MNRRLFPLSDLEGKTQCYYCFQRKWRELKQQEMITAPFTKSLALYLQYSQITEVDKHVFWQVKPDNTGNNPKEENKH